MAFFLVSMVLALLAKIWLAAALPITGDEAYFYWWGVHPAWGHYDHPPMVGWMIAALRLVGEHPLWLRLPTVLLTLVIAIGIIDLIRRIRPDRQREAWGAAAIYMLLPISWIGVPVTTDTPLIMFLFMSGYALLRAELACVYDQGGLSRLNSRGQPRGRHREWVWLAASGMFLGLAFLSKYFAVLMAVAYAAVLLRPRSLGGHGFFAGTGRLLLVGICAMPLVAINIGYNAANCWNNVMFNAVNRHEDAAWGWKNTGIYLGMMLYLVTPWLAWQILRATPAVMEPAGGRSSGWSGSRAVRPALSALLMALVPFLLFLVISFKKSVGLHWVLAFIPFLMVAAGCAVDLKRLGRSAGWTGLLSVPHLAFFLFVLLAPLSIWQNVKLNKDLAYLRDVETLPAALMQDAPQDTVLMARAYTPASILGFHAGRYVPVFGTGKFHARQDDVLVDFREFEGRTIRIFDKTQPGLSDLEPFFESVSRSDVVVNGNTYWMIEGRGFRFAPYRESVLAVIDQRYYQLPQRLPVLGCPFKQRYGF